MPQFSFVLVLDEDCVGPFETRKAAEEFAKEFAPSIESAVGMMESPRAYAVSYFEAQAKKDESEAPPPSPSALTPYIAPSH